MLIPSFTGCDPKRSFRGPWPKFLRRVHSFRREAPERLVDAVAKRLARPARPPEAAPDLNVRQRLLARMAKGDLTMVEGSAAVELVDELGPEPGDLISPRYHGISPFSGTSLDAWLRNLGVTTVVATGVSVNLGVVGMCIEAANLGYRIVVPVDAVAGFPRDYVEAMLEHTIALVATRSTVDQVVAAWSR